MVLISSFEVVISHENFIFARKAHAKILFKNFARVRLIISQKKNEKYFRAKHSCETVCFVRNYFPRVLYFCTFNHNPNGVDWLPDSGQNFFARIFSRSFLSIIFSYNGLVIEMKLVQYFHWRFSQLIDLI